jgi:predicted exporter
MSKQQYLRALNKEIQKLNGLIDDKIVHGYDYKREARRHRELLRQLRKEERRRTARAIFSFGLFSRV